MPLNIELKLEVWDSPNTAGVVIDAVRCAKLALDRGIGGALEGPSAYFMKTPPMQYTDDEVAREMVEAFIRDEEPVAPASRPRAKASSRPRRRRATPARAEPALRRGQPELLPAML